MPRRRRPCLVGLGAFSAHRGVCGTAGAEIAKGVRCSSPPRCRTAGFVVDVGIADIDSYAMLFYGNYFKYNERAANALLPASAGVGVAALLMSSTSRRRHLVKYANRVGWNDDVRVRSTRVGDAGAEETLLHEWIVGGKTVHSALMTYTMACGATFAGALTPDVSGERRAKAAQREASQLFSCPESTYRREEFVVYPDHVNGLGRLGAPCILDFFERQRTTLIGGQDELERLKAEDQVMIVVYSIQQLRFLPTAVRPREKIVVSSGFCVQNEMFYCVHQSIKAASGELIADGYLKLVFVHGNGAVGKAPAATLARLAAATGVS